MDVRKRIGLIMPASDSTTEPDFYRLLGTDEFSIHTQRLWDGKDIAGADRMDRMNLEIETAVGYLNRAEIDAVAYCCTTGSFYRGQGWDRQIVDKLETISGVPAVATTPSVVEALKHLGSKKISVITPYPKWNNERLQEYLLDKGFDVLNINTPSDASEFSFNMCNHSPGVVLDYGLEKLLPEADTLLVSCTGWRSVEVIDELESRTGKMVVTANQATIWFMLEKLGWSKPIQGFGQLLSGQARIPVA